MFTFSLAEAFITLFIGMGPIKVLLIYIAKTQRMDKDIKRKVAQRTVIVAAGVAVALFIAGAVIQQLLHFSIGALNIIGGLILLLLAINMVLGGGAKPEGTEGDVQDPMSMAISPLAIPLTLNPIGIVTLVVASSEVTDIPSSFAVVVMIAIVSLIDLVVLLGSDYVAKYLSEAAVHLLEVLLGIFLGAMAVQLVLNGLANVGAITLTGGH